MSPAETAHALIGILSNPETCLKMGVAGRKRAEQFYSMTAMLGAYRDLYHKLARKPLPPAAARECSRWNIPNTCSACFCGMPMPLSVTVNCTHAPCACADRCTRSGLGERISLALAGLRRYGLLASDRLHSARRAGRSSCKSKADRVSALLVEELVLPPRPFALKHVPVQKCKRGRSIKLASLVRVWARGCPCHPRLGFPGRHDNAGLYRPDPRPGRMRRTGALGAFSLQ